MVPDSASAVKAVACRVARADTSDGGERGEPMATIPARSKFHGAILSAWVRFGCAILKTWPPLPKLIGGVRKGDMTPVDGWAIEDYPSQGHSTLGRNTWTLPQPSFWECLSTYWQRHFATRGALL